MKPKLRILDFYTPASTDDVATALSLVRDALGVEQKRINGEGAKAMQSGDYDTATAVIEFARRLLVFNKKVEDLVDEWNGLENLRDESSPAVQEIVSKRFFGKKMKGEITPHTDFCPYILQVLVEMGGGGKTKAVLDWVGDLMKGVLKPQDYEFLKSGKTQVRWRNSAQWARNTMVNVDGRMAATPTGIWEISDKGRKWLKENEGSK
ncbi:MAG: winged helix-turn-helix domain-containing protein [Verrucomicrobia bacterium]|nr:winged helix-turn-helix domain-containing protein [Verrucomicrobiota bacterium]